MLLQKRRQLVVIHDERADRTTEGIGYVRDYTLSELKKPHIYAGDNPNQSIPTMEEVFDLYLRAWIPGHLYPERPTGTKLELTHLGKMGITDIILNEPEVYIV